MKLRRNQLCPIHRSRTCCGREPIRKEKILQVGVRLIEDPHHPRGYRELRSPAEMRKLLNARLSSTTGFAGFAILNSETLTTWYPIMKIRKEWEGLGETIIHVTSEPSTGGAILKKDQRGWTSDGRSPDDFRVARDPLGVECNACTNWAK